MTRVNPMKVAFSIGLWLCLMLGLIVFYWWQWLNAAHVIAPMQRYFVVEKGESLQSVSRRLYDADLIRWPKIWLLYARFYDSEPIKQGEYNFSDIESPAGILDKLQSDDVITYDVTLVEGKSFKELVAHLSDKPKLVSRLAGAAYEIQLELLGLNISHPEGWFFPDTYQYIAGDSDLSILKRAHKKMRAVLEREWQARSPGLPYQSPYEALIMASIVEKETGLASERGDIAGVFVRRLQNGMRLQTDPTVIYGMGELYQGNITRADLKTPTPYNTYVINGLPPTPIAMPSAEAIRASLNPADGEALYFVARGDGSHVFSSSLEAHNKAVRQYQIEKRATQYRSAPSSD